MRKYETEKQMVVSIKVDHRTCNVRTAHSLMQRQNEREDGGHQIISMCPLAFINCFSLLGFDTLSEDNDKMKEGGKFTVKKCRSVDLN